MSDNDSDINEEDIPDADTCQKLCEEFAAITQTDTACAQFYLQDRKWDLSRSIDDFFEHKKNRGGIRSLSDGSDKSEVVVVVDGSRERLAAAATAVLIETLTSNFSQRRNTPVASTSSRRTVESGDCQVDEVSEPSQLGFITWNIDGLHESNLKLRTKHVCKIIENSGSDVVFLQEVVPQSAEYILKYLPNYECIFGNEVGYFCATLLKKETVSFEGKEIIDFPNSVMMRNIVKVQAKVSNTPLCLLNCHLESTGEHAPERKRQTMKSFDVALNRPSSETVILAGDLNMRDKELQEIGGLPAGLEDLWVVCGSRKECSYTWDMTRNDNVKWTQKFKPRCRFDRAYVRHSSPSKIKPTYFGLIGLERLRPHRCFPSDHWGILCHFSFEN